MNMRKPWRSATEAVDYDEDQGYDLIATNRSADRRLLRDMQMSFGADRTITIVWPADLTTVERADAKGFLELAISSLMRDTIEEPLTFRSGSADAEDRPLLSDEAK